MITQTPVTNAVAAAGIAGRGERAEGQPMGERGVGRNNTQYAPESADTMTDGFVAAPIVSEGGGAEREGARENGRSRSRGRGRGRGRGERNNYGDNQFANGTPPLNIAGSEQPSVAPDAFTHPKQEQWAAKPRTAPTEMPAEQPGSFAPAANHARDAQTSAAGIVPDQSGVAGQFVRQKPESSSAEQVPQNITTEPVVTRLTPEGEADAEGTAGRKGWWNKLMGA